MTSQAGWEWGSAFNTEGEGNNHEFSIGLACFEEDVFEDMV